MDNPIDPEIINRVIIELDRVDKLLKNRQKMETDDYLRQWK